MAYFWSDIDIIVFFVGRDENEWVGGIVYLVGSPKVGGAGDGKHKKKYGHPYKLYGSFQPMIGMNDIFPECLLLTGWLVPVKMHA